MMRTGSNIRRRADGRFEARYIKGRDKLGRAVYASCYGQTYEEAERKRAEAQRRNLRVRELNLLILGAGSHGQEVLELARSLNVFRRIAFLDDAKEGVLGPCRGLSRWTEEWPCAVAAVGDWTVRRRWLEELAEEGFVLPVLIHPSATVSPSAELGYGTVVCARAVIGPGARIGRGCIISGGAAIDRDAAVPEGTHILCGQAVGAGRRIDQEGVLLYG